MMQKSGVGALKKSMALDFGSCIAKTTPSYSLISYIQFPYKQRKFLQI